MFMKSGLNVEKKSNVKRDWGLKVLSNFALKAMAEEVAGGAGESVSEPTPPTQSNVNYEDLIARARKEEKDKLYPKIKKLEDDLKAATESLNNALLREGAFKDEVDKLKKEQGDSTKVTDLEAEIERLKGEIETAKNSAPNAEELRKEIEEEYKLKDYARQKVAEAGEEIISTYKNVEGKTEEEIDKAIEKAKADSLALRVELGLVELDEDGKPIIKDDKNKKLDKKDKPDDKNNTNNNKPPIAPNPGSGSGNATFDAEYVRNLDPKSPEYAEWRKQAGLT